MKDEVKEAAKFAIEAHGGQRYGERTPYAYHLALTYQNAKRFSGSTNEQMAAWLHDVVEDTSVTLADVQKRFGYSVAHIIDLVTNTGSKEATYKRIRTSQHAVFVKLCDRLANIMSGSKNDMYKKQQPLFKSILYRKGEFENLWQAIDKHLGS